MNKEEIQAKLRKGTLDFTSGILQGADLRGVDLQGADLQGADLQGADLSSAILRGVDLQGAILRGVDLQGADLRGADLRSGILQDADLQGADLDFSCLPLWCGSLKSHFDDRQLRQIAYHLVSAGLNSKNASEETKIEIAKLVDFANGFHRAGECGKIKIEEERP